MSDDITFCIAECNTKCFRKPSRIRDRSIPHSFADFSKNCMAYEPKDEPQTPYDECKLCKFWFGYCHLEACDFAPIEDEPPTQLTAKCLECNNSKACKENHWDVCRYEPLGYEVTAVVGTIKDESQTDKHKCRRCVYYDVSSDYYPCVSCVDYSNYTGEIEDEPQTERIKTLDYCGICNHKGCDNCIANNLDDYCVPSGYAPKDTPQTDCSKNCPQRDVCTNVSKTRGFCKELKEHDGLSIMVGEENFCCWGERRTE